MDEQLWWEDLTVGTVFDLGECPVERDEVIDFATRYDPQPFHIDDAAAAANPLFGRLSASGVHTFAMTSRVIFDGFQRERIRPLGGGGADEMRFSHPVFPGDVLRVTGEIVDARALSSRTDRGLAKMLTVASNQDGTAVLSYTSTMFFARRPGA